MAQSKNDDSSDLLTADRLRLNKRRVAILDCLHERDEPTSLAGLASSLLSRQDTATDRTETDRIERRLHHVDLPMLDDIGFVTYDADERIAAAHAVDLNR